MWLLGSLVSEMNKSQLAGSCMAAIFQWCIDNNEHMKHLNELMYLLVYFYCIASSSLNE